MKIEIKHFSSLKVLFSFESENNTIKKTVEQAVKKGAYIRGADLRGADLRGADLTYADLTYADLTDADLTGANLRGAYLRGAYLRGADLTYADLTYADLTDADLTGVNLRGAYLTGAYLRGADLRGADLSNIKIKKAIVFTGLYKYVAVPIIAEDDETYIKLGCHLRKVSEWEQDFWNNPSEFPNDNSIKSQMRVFAFETAKKWIELNK
jgi:hypothetical protein